MRPWTRHSALRRPFAWASSARPGTSAGGGSGSYLGTRPCNWGGRGAAGGGRAAGPPALVGSPGCYPTATVLALAPLTRAGLVADVVVDAKRGVGGAGREAGAEMGFA